MMIRMQIAHLKVIFMGDDFEGMNYLYNKIIGKKIRVFDTLAVRFETIDLELEEESIGKIMFRLHLWIPEEKWSLEEARPLYFKLSHLGIIVFDPEKEETFRNLEGWIKKFVENNRKKVFLNKILLG